MGLLTDRINIELEKSNLINEHALNREPVPLNGLLAHCSELELKRNVLVTYQTLDARGLVLVIIRRLKTNKQRMKKGIMQSFSTLVSFMRLACFIAKLKISLK